MIRRAPSSAILLALLLLAVPPRHAQTVRPGAAPAGGGLALPLARPSILVYKARRQLLLLDGGREVRRYPVGLGLSPIGDKVREGDYRTPEGDFYVCMKNPKSRFLLSLGLSYPNAEDAERGLRDGLITRRQRDSILGAVRRKGIPPWTTRLGGAIFIHGSGSQSDWTWGCVALDDPAIRELYDAVSVGTPVRIEPCARPTAGGPGTFRLSLFTEVPVEKSGSPKNVLLDQLRLRAEYLKEMGLDYAVDRPGLHAAKGRPGEVARGDAPAPGVPSSVPVVKLEGALPPLVLPEPGGVDPAADLRAIREAMGECTRCRLCRARTQIVFGVGNPRARLMFIGEGPGEEEDRQGIPFVGRAGQLLTSIITRGMGVSRDDVYIGNVVKCRPPQNRTPEDDEMASCFPFLRAQILAIRPEVIVTLGRPAAHTLLGPGTIISKLRGRWGKYEGIPVMPTYHPSYLLRNPVAKKDVWDDIQKVMAKLGIPVPKSQGG